MAHTASGRTATLPDGSIGAWVIVDGKETWCGNYANTVSAKFALNRQIYSLNTGWGNPPSQGALP